jgi:hypothetical protein
VAVYGDDEEYGDVFPRLGERNGADAQRKELCEKLIRRLGLLTSRKEPLSVCVEVFKVTRRDGRDIRRSCGKYRIMLPFRPMTAEEYEAEMAALLVELPDAFHAYIRSEAYAQGHSGGLEEVILLATNMVAALKPYVTDYAAALRK